MNSFHHHQHRNLFIPRGNLRRFTVTSTPDLVEIKTTDIRVNGGLLFNCNHSHFYNYQFCPYSNRPNRMKCKIEEALNHINRLLELLSKIVNMF